METGNPMTQGNESEDNQLSSKKLVDEKLLEISSKISTIEGWEEYINTYYPTFCSSLAKMEAKSNSMGIDEQTNARPIAVITGGQPGAGKSALLATYKATLKERHGINAIVNNADFYRFCIPGTFRIAADFPESASRVTDPVVKKMRKSLIEESISQGQSIIIENTLGDTIAVDIIQQGDVHEIWIAVLAVPREESLLSDFERYIKMKESSSVARLVSVEAHDKRYYALDSIAAQLEAKGIRTLIHSRGKTEEDFTTVEYDSSDKTSKKYESTVDAMSSVRRKNFRENVEGYGERLRTIREKMESFGMTPDEEDELRRLEEIIQLSIAKEKEGRGE